MFRKASITLETRSVSGLADLVDGSGEVEHLAPEAPLVVVPDMRLRCLLVYTLPGSAHPHGMSATAPDNPQHHSDGQKCHAFP